MVKKVAANKAQKSAPGADQKEFAVIQTGGKQYMVAEGDTVKIEKLKKPTVAGKKE